MFKKPRREDFPILADDEGTAEFHKADVLYALEWSATAPGAGGWDVLVDDEARTRLVSVVPPGSNVPTFLIFRKGAETEVIWINPATTGEVLEVGRYPSLRAAVLALCPLHEALVQKVNEAMESLYPRTLRHRQT